MGLVQRGDSIEADRGGAGRCRTGGTRCCTGVSEVFDEVGDFLHQLFRWPRSRDTQGGADPHGVL